MNFDRNIDCAVKTSQPNWLVLKFGGSSVGDPKHWPTITQQVELTLSKGYRPFLVLSALKNVSNLLEALLHQALAGVHPMAIEHLKEMHLSFAAQIGLDLSAQLNPFFTQLTEECQQIHLDKHISPKLHARVLSTGELLSSTIGHFYLRSRNIDCHWKDARTLLKADEKSEQNADLWHHYTNAVCHYQIAKNTNQAIDALNQQEAQVIVTQGFIAADEQGDTVLLGREGSDTSAAYFGALLDASEIQIWTDVPGVFSCNPRDNNQARLLRHLNYNEASQMAQLGAKVLHPRALQPALDCSIPILVKSTHLPSYQGTIINADESNAPSIKAVVNESPVILFETAHSALFTKTFEKKLMALGYDLIIKSIIEDQSLEKTLFIMRYTNSDQAEPNLKTLSSMLQTSSSNQDLHNQTQLTSITNKLSLISIVGICNQANWQKEVTVFCQQQSQLSYLELIPSLESGRVSLLVSEDGSLLWAQALHQHFIENNNTNNAYGENWASFC